MQFTHDHATAAVPPLPATEAVGGQDPPSLRGVASSRPWRRPSRPRLATWPRPEPLRATRAVCKREDVQVIPCMSRPQRSWPGIQRVLAAAVARTACKGTPPISRCLNRSFATIHWSVHPFCPIAWRHSAAWWRILSFASVWPRQGEVTARPSFRRPTELDG